MSKINQALGFACLLFLGAGCSTVTNLTASKQPRNNTNLYPVEATMRSNQQSLIPESVRPYVLVGIDQIPMEPVPVVKGRWQAYVPVSRGLSEVFYRFKFDYAYYDIPVKRTNSVLSPEYKLSIKDN